MTARSISTTRAHLLTCSRQMIRIRRFEEKCVELYQREKIRGFLHLYDGEEAVAVGVMQALGPEDAVVATYREHGQAIARGVPMAAVMAEMYGKARGLLPRPRRLDAPVRPRHPVLRRQRHRRRRSAARRRSGAWPTRCRAAARVTACFFGEGAVDEGEFHESLNLAELWRLPVLFVCENNLYAMGMAWSAPRPRPDIHREGAELPHPERSGGRHGRRSPSRRRPGGRPSSIRGGNGPYFLECRTYRFRAHSMFDAAAYRDKDEIEAWKQQATRSCASRAG